MENDSQIAITLQSQTSRVIRNLVRDTKNPVTCIRDISLVYYDRKIKGPGDSIIKNIQHYDAFVNNNDNIL